MENKNLLYPVITTVLTEIPAVASASSEIRPFPAQLDRHLLRVTNHTAYFIRNDLADSFCHLNVSVVYNS